MKIYLAGKMRGVPHFNFPAFIDATDRLRRAGHVVFNPAERDIEAGFDYKQAPSGSDEDMRRQNFSLRDALGADLEWICKEAQAVALLPGWESSAGVRAEVATGLALGLNIYRYNPGSGSPLDPVDVEVISRVVSTDDGSGEEGYYPEDTSKIEAFLQRTGPSDSFTAGAFSINDSAAPFYNVSTSGSSAPKWTPSTGSTTPATPTQPAISLPVSTLITMTDPYVKAKLARDLIDSHEGETTEEGFDKAFDRGEPVKIDINAGDKYAGSGEVRTTSAKGGQKGVKLAAYHLIPAEPLRLLAEHYGRGASKYADHQWRKGYEWSKSFAALNRHLWQFWNGEDLDTDEGPLNGSPHMAAVAWHAFALLEFMQTNRDLDDRPSTRGV
jgi:hypothetical protein